MFSDNKQLISGYKNCQIFTRAKYRKFGGIMYEYVINIETDFYYNILRNPVEFEINGKKYFLYIKSDKYINGHLMIESKSYYRDDRLIGYKIFDCDATFEMKKDCCSKCIIKLNL